MHSYEIFAALLYAIPFVLSDSISKKVLLKFGAYTTGVMLLSIGLIPIAIISLLYNFGPISAYLILTSSLSGIMLAAGYILFYKTVATEHVSNSIVFSELGSAIFVIFGFFVLGESIRLAGIFGAAMVFIGGGLVALTEDLKFNKRLLPAMSAFILWSSSFIIISYPIKLYGSFGFALIIARIAALLSFIAIARALNLHKNTGTHAHKSYGDVLSIGLLDGTGMAGFGLAAIIGAIGLAGVMNAMVPVIGAIIGFILYKERFTKLQLFGFSLMILGAVIVSIA